MREYYGKLREFPDKSSKFGLLYRRVYGPLRTLYTAITDELLILSQSQLDILFQEPPLTSRWPSRNRTSKYGNGVPLRQPALRGGCPLRVYVAPGGKIPFLTDLILRVGWILNLMGLSGIVLLMVNQMKVRS